MKRIRQIVFILLLPVITFSQTGEKRIAFRALTVDDGLSQNSVVSIAMDHTGFMWFATQDGLNKYDGKRFKHYPFQFEDVTRNTFSKLGKVYVDHQNAVWIITNSGKLHKQIKSTERFQFIDNLVNVSTLFQSNNRDFYFGTYGSGLFKISHATHDTIQLLEPDDRALTIYDFIAYDDKILAATTTGILQIGNSDYELITIDRDVNFSAFAKSTKTGDLYLGSYGKGLFVNRGKLNFRPFKGFEKASLPDDLIIQDMLVDRSDKLWVATYGNGVYLIDFENETIQHFMANKVDPYALHYNDVLSLYEDFTGIIWLGTDGSGLSYYDKDLVKFNVLTNKQAPNHVNIDFVRAIVEMEHKVWLGTSNKGLTLVDFKQNEFKMYTTENSTLASDRVMSLINSDGFLWVGHQNSGLQKLEGDTFKSYPDTEGMSIWKIYKASENRLWLCTLNGLILYDEEHGVVKTYTSKNSALASNAIRTVEADDHNRLWIGTESEGLYVLHLNNGTLSEIEAVQDHIKSLYYDAGVLWIGTNGNGLKAYNVTTQAIKHFTTAEGLANNVIYAILPDEDNNLWLSSNKGLTKASISDDTILNIKNFSNYDGLQTNEFNTGAYFKGENGTLYFGGLEGLNWFNPSQISYNNEKPRTVITDVEVFAKSKPIIQHKTYPAQENTMTFTFSGLHYSQPDRNQYRYKLENHDPDWIFAGNDNTAHYTNLSPNDYTFKVISSNYDGVWNETPATYAFTINKPWYLSSLALIFYTLILLGLGLAFYRYLKWRWYMKMQLEMEHQETQRLKKLDELKTKLYTNISHEFRTPLTLISGPIENQLSKPQLSGEDRKQLSMVRDNSKRLMELVDQMLDLSKLESGHFKLAVEQGDLDVLLSQIAEAFQYKSQQKAIQLECKILPMKGAWYDPDIIEKIVSNLLSNAVKYTPNNGKIYFEATPANERVIMTFTNNGNTIPQERLEQLFQRYYQDVNSHDGVGIGLSLVKELATLSHGKIEATTLNEDEIQFQVTLPISRSSYNRSEIISIPNSKSVNEEPEFIEERSKIVSKNNSDRPILLIVEDNIDINNFVASIFEERYHVLQATDGEEGIDMALESIPDVIITDLMMPEIDGIQLCEQLKYDIKTSHIPIIMLTAKTDEADQIKGLKIGADAYLTKPFSPEKLKLIVENQLALIEKWKQRYVSTLSIDPDVSVNSRQSAFLKRLKEVLDNNLTDPDFSAAGFCQAMHMSRTQLHRKLTASFGESTTGFIRTQRLKLAQELLHKSHMTVAEISYEVGFNSPSYFNKCFKETFGCTPKEYASDHL